MSKKQRLDLKKNIFLKSEMRFKNAYKSSGRKIVFYSKYWREKCLNRHSNFWDDLK